ncbi:MAG TPA: VOC family protein [Burkholderiales bacterium]|nr:VOC family protein [Burkholderiales bacterium]
MERARALWPATLHHLCRAGPEPERLARFYGELLGDKVERVGEDWLVSGPGRRLVVGGGEKGAVPYFALRAQDAGRLRECRRELEKKARIEPSPSPLFGADAFAVADPDGRKIVIGLADAHPGGGAGRLQHFVCASTRLEAMLEFYRDVLGLQESDRVLEDQALAAVFLRSDPEHHSFAAFRAPESRADHHCYETRSWNDIRDWADRMARLRIPLWWGPGRHGPGNNLFFMIEDPDGHKVEFSAELEQLPAGAPFRTWPHEQRTLNLWGSAWMRS